MLAGPPSAAARIRMRRRKRWKRGRVGMKDRGRFFVTLQTRHQGWLCKWSGEQEAVAVLIKGTIDRMLSTWLVYNSMEAVVGR
jgi:hypothetical protein